MSERAIFFWIVGAWMAVAAAVSIVLTRMSAPYGRHARDGWGPTLPAWLGWIIMEAPSPIVMAACFVSSERQASQAAAVFLLLWECHYVYRAFVFPLWLRGGGARMPLLVALSAIAFNLVNAWLNGRWLFSLGPERGPEWFGDPRFLIGVALFAGGYAIHLKADATVRRMRAKAGGAYVIPRGFLFERVSCPNYFGEIVEWAGFALLTWSPAGLAFAAWTAANLVPRALSHHRWYLERFSNYPRSRRALVPFLF